MNTEENQTALEKNRSLLLAILDYYLKYQVGSMVFDQWDPAEEHYLREKENAEKYFQEFRLDLLQQRIGSLIYSLVQRNDSNFLSYIKQRTGYDIDLSMYGPENDEFTALTSARINEGEPESVSSKGTLADQPSPLATHRRIMTNTYDDGKNGHTAVSIVLKGGSGCIYCAQGANLQVNAYWKDNSTVVIETKEEYPVMIQHKTVRSFDDTVSIEYTF